MLAHHVETQVLEYLQIVNHGLSVGGQVQAIGPVTLVQSAHEENKVTVDERSLNSINHAR